jgi:hypothetical protein
MLRYNVPHAHQSNQCSTVTPCAMLTHLIICFNLTIARFDFSSSDDFMPIFARPGGETGLTGADIAKMHHTVQHKLRRVYQRIKHCWCEKAVRWTGKLVHTMASKLDKYAGITK